MRAVKPTCDHIGCEPVSGQCLGFCGVSRFNGQPEMPIQFAGKEPVNSYFDFPEAEEEADQDMRGTMSMLAYLVLSGFALALVSVVAFLIFR